MERTIAVEQINLFSFPEKYEGTKDKFLVTLAFVPFTDLKEKREFLISKGIEVVPSQLSVFLTPIEEIKQVVSEYELNGDLQALQENPKRINSKGALRRLNYLKQAGLPYKNEKGKYLPEIFSARLFNPKYNYVDSEVTISEKPVETNEFAYTAPVAEEPVVASPAVETPVAAFSEISDDTIVLGAPVVENTEVQSPISFNDFAEPIQEPTPAVEPEPVEEETNEYIETLRRRQTADIGPDDYEKYEQLSEYAREVMMKVSDNPELPGEIIANLINLITSGKEDNKKIIYYAMTFNKKISPEFDAALNQAIEEVVDFNNDYTDIYRR